MSSGVISLAFSETTFICGVVRIPMSVHLVSVSRFVFVGVMILLVRTIILLVRVLLVVE